MSEQKIINALTQQMLDAYEDAYRDSLIYGTGFLRVAQDGTMTHVPYREIVTTETEALSER